MVWDYYFVFLINLHIRMLIILVKNHYLFKKQNKPNVGRKSNFNKFGCFFSTLLLKYLFRMILLVQIPSFHILLHSSQEFFPITILLFLFVTKLSLTLPLEAGLSYILKINFFTLNFTEIL